MPSEFIEEVKNIISSSLPTSANIVGKVINTIYNKSSNATDLAQIIERDPPLTADIIKVANSAYYGASKKINSIKKAVVILGFDTIKELVTTITTLRYIFDVKRPAAIDLSGLWLHSVGTAKAAQLVSEELNKERPDVVYTTGLLHDIGKILLALSFPELYGQIVKLSAEEKCHIILAEQKVMNTNHCMIGTLLCDMWSLPDDIRNAIYFHHETKDNPFENMVLTRIIQLGDTICRKAKIGNPGDEVIPQPPTPALALLGSSFKEVNNKFGELFQKFKESSDDIVGFYGGMK